MSQDPKPPLFLDDPKLQAELEALDRGLTDPALPDDRALPRPPEPRPARVAPVSPAPAESPATPSGIFPESTLAPEAGSPSGSRPAKGGARAGMPQWADAPTPAATGDSRPLLSLFPPAFGQRERARPSGASGRAEQPVEGRGPTAGAPPPRIVRSRLALRADAAERPPTREEPMSASASYDESVAAAVADLEELVPEPSAARRTLGKVERAMILFALMLMGAAAAAWVYWTQVSQLLGR